VWGVGTNGAAEDSEYTVLPYKIEDNGSTGNDASHLNWRDVQVETRPAHLLSSFSSFRHYSTFNQVTATAFRKLSGSLLPVIPSSELVAASLIVQISLQNKEREMMILMTIKIYFERKASTLIPAQTGQETTRVRLNTL
jgi:hypothetical protein